MKINLQSQLNNTICFYYWHQLRHHYSNAHTIHWDLHNWDVRQFDINLNLNLSISQLKQRYKESKREKERERERERKNESALDMSNLNINTTVVWLSILITPLAGTGEGVNSADMAHQTVIVIVNDDSAEEPVQQKIASTTMITTTQWWAFWKLQTHQYY